LMTTKPGWAGSIGTPLLLTILGGVIGSVVTRSRGARTAKRRASVTSRPLAHGGANTP